VIIPRST